MENLDKSKGEDKGLSAGWLGGIVGMGLACLAWMGCCAWAIMKKMGRSKPDARSRAKSFTQETWVSQERGGRTGQSSRGPASAPIYENDERHNNDENYDDMTTSQKESRERGETYENV